MIFRNLDANGDWTFGQGLSNYAKAELAIDLNIKTRILSWVGNCFFDLPAGIDWLTRLDKGQQQNLVNDLTALILQSYGVVAVNSIGYNLDAERVITVTYNIQTIYTRAFQSSVSSTVGATA